MDIWVRIAINEELLGECDNPDNPTKRDITEICQNVDISDIRDYYRDDAITVIGRED